MSARTRGPLHVRGRSVTAGQAAAGGTGSRTRLSREDRIFTGGGITPDTAGGTAAGHPHHRNPTLTLG
ncbi:hypothetical protein GCM10009639_63920 [Kitasatospora putterlickiae]|uniref:Uncharacterized protein n=1 Tax=Kitasatospora putterlickiae TaxID=221725 RepID=A0ABN1YGD0_9ACTN